MMLAVSIAFLVLLYAAHTGGDVDLALRTPLSMFRDGRDSTLGYWMFGLLLAAGAILMQLLVRLRWWGDAFALLMSFALLIVVASTPSADFDHLFVAMVLLLSVYIYYAFLFHRLGSRWFWVHLLAPVLIGMLLQWHSYGLWQKSLIVYFVATMNAQYYAFKSWQRPTVEKAPPRTKKFRDTERRQKVYSLDD